MARGRRLTRALGALLLGALCVAVPATAAPACAVTGAIRTGSDGWTRIAAPAFSVGGDAMTTYAVDEMRPDRLFATNGVSISSTRDGGCTWTEAALPPEQLAGLGPLGGESGGVVQRRLLDLRLAGVSSSTVWAAALNEVANGATPLVEPRVLVSDDGGRTFTARTTGLPRFGRPVALRVGLTPLTAYLLVQEDVPTSRRTLYLTTNAGSLWTEVATGLPALADFAVDPFRRVLWGWNDQALFQSADSGKTWQRVQTPAAPVAVDVAPMFTAIALANGERFDVAAIGVMRSTVPEHLTSVTAGSEYGLVAASSVVAGVTVEPPLRVPGRRTVDVTPDDVSLSRLNLAQVTVGGEYVLYGFSPRGIFRRALPYDFAIPPPPKPVVTVKKRLPPPPGKPALRPGGSLVTLKPGEKRTVPYDLVLPPTPTPLDVYFMTDSTGSMAGAIAAVQASVQDIVDDLTAAGINLHFGVADFRDYPQAPADSTTYPYKRRRAVGPVNDDLADALASITTGGGNGDDSALEAVYQAVTGAGRTGLTATIPPGEDAEFRRDALKVVLVASDDEMRDPSPTEPWNAGPSKEAVIQALVENDVEVVGIRVDSGPGGGNPRPEMEELAEGAGSVAPPGGVDCDGDDEPDIDEGEPLVCDFTSSDDSIAPAFINMLRGLRDLADVHVGVNGPRDVVRHLGDTTFESVNVKALNTLPVPVEYACTPARYGTDTPVTISGSLRGATLVSTTATVRCLAPRKAAPVIPPVVPKPPPPPLRAAAVAPPPPPQPNPNVNPNPNPNPQAQGQGGLAAEENQQHQLALADNELPEDEELAFSALDTRNDVTPAVTLVAGMLVACAAAGTQLHLARRTRLATNPSRTPRGARP